MRQEPDLGARPVGHVVLPLDLCSGATLTVLDVADVGIPISFPIPRVGAAHLAPATDLPFVSDRLVSVVLGPTVLAAQEIRVRNAFGDAVGQFLEQATIVP